MIKGTLILIGFAVLNLGAANPNPEARFAGNVTSVELQISHLDIQSDADGMTTKVADEADFAFRLTLESGRVVSVRF